MDREALALVRRLGAAAFGPGAGSGSGAKPDPHRPTGPAAGTGVGEAGRELDIFPEIYTSTLAVVGSAAYGCVRGCRHMVPGSCLVPPVPCA